MEVMYKLIATLNKNMTKQLLLSMLVPDIEDESITSKRQWLYNKTTKDNHTYDVFNISDIEYGVQITQPNSRQSYLVKNNIITIIVEGTPNNNDALEGIGAFIISSDMLEPNEKFNLNPYMLNAQRANDLLTTKETQRYILFTPNENLEYVLDYYNIHRTLVGMASVAVLLNPEDLKAFDNTTLEPNSVYIIQTGKNSFCQEIDDILEAFPNLIYFKIANFLGLVDKNECKKEKVFSQKYCTLAYKLYCERENEIKTLKETVATTKEIISSFESTVQELTNKAKIQNTKPTQSSDDLRLYEAEVKELEENKKQLGNKIVELEKKCEALTASVEKYKNSIDTAHLACIKLPPDEKEFYEGEVHDLLVKLIDEKAKSSKAISNRRSYHLLKGLLKINQRSENGRQFEKKLENVGEMLQNHSANKSALEKLDFYVETANHPRIKFKDDIRYQFTISSTPSDCNSVHVIQRNIENILLG